MNNNQFLEVVQTNRVTFPHLNELQQIFYEDDFNTILNIIKNRIIMARRTNNKDARILHNELMNISQPIINDVKLYLKNERGYIITEIEDINNNYVGFKVSF
jgi:hypothetical protein